MYENSYEKFGTLEEDDLSIEVANRTLAESAPPPIFICENNRKSNKIMHCIDLFVLRGSFSRNSI